MGLHHQNAPHWPWTRYLRAAVRSHPPVSRAVKALASPYHQSGGVLQDMTEMEFPINPKGDLVNLHNVKTPDVPSTWVLWSQFKAFTWLNGFPDELCV